MPGSPFRMTMLTLYFVGFAVATLPAYMFLMWLEPGRLYVMSGIAFAVLYATWVTYALPVMNWALGKGERR